MGSDWAWSVRVPVPVPVPVRVPVPWESVPVLGWSASEPVPGHAPGH
jgi:hypothetical protein